MLKAIEILDKWPCLIDFHAEENVAHRADSSCTHTWSEEKKPLLKYVHVIIDVYLHACHMGTMELKKMIRNSSLRHGFLMFAPFQDQGSMHILHTGIKQFIGGHTWLL